MASQIYMYSIYKNTNTIYIQERDEFLVEGGRDY